jgi:hypothetical protein
VKILCALLKGREALCRGAKGNVFCLVIYSGFSKMHAYPLVIEMCKDFDLLSGLSMGFTPSLNSVPKTYEPTCTVNCHFIYIGRYYRPVILFWWF